MTTAIVDLSALYWRNWHSSEGDEVSSAKRKTLGFVNGIFGQYENIIVALDAPPYKRKEFYPEYKSNRPERNEAAIEELKNTVEAIAADGHTVARCQGMEADDVIATLMKQYPDATVYGADKDLLQCCDITDPYSGKVKTAMGFLGIPREKVCDYLTLDGDKSDNVPGVPGIGAKTAVKMIETLGGIDGIYEALETGSYKFSDKMRETLEASAETVSIAYQLVRLDDSLELEIEKREIQTKNTMEVEMEEQKTEVVQEDTQQVETEIVKSSEVQHLVKHEEVGYRQALEPIGPTQLWALSQAVIESRMYSNFPTAEAVMMTIMRGRVLGLDATTALDSINMIKGKPCMSSALMLALVMDSPKCEYMMCTDMGDSSCTWETKRVNNPKPSVRTFTREDADRGGFTVAYNKKTGRTDTKDNWNKQPDVMLQWRCAAALIRQVYPDVIAGLYAKEEME